MVNLKRIGWEDGTLVSKAKVEVSGQIYDVEPEQYTGTTPLSAANLKEMEDNTEKAIIEATEKNIITAYSTETQKGVSNSTTVTLSESISVGDKLTLQNNAIVIGREINKVKVSGVIYFENLTDVQIYLFPRIMQNNETLLAPIVSKASNQFEAVVFAEALVEVAEGDKFTLNVGDVNNLKVNVKGNRNATYLTVEAVE